LDEEDLLIPRSQITRDVQKNDNEKLDEDEENPVTERDLKELRDHINAMLTPSKDKEDNGTVKKLTFLPVFKVEVHRK
jgi:hypothetical protein